MNTILLRQFTSVRHHRSVYKNVSNLLLYLGSDLVITLPVTIETFYNLLHQAPTAPKNDHVLNETCIYTDSNHISMTVLKTHKWLIHTNTFCFSLGCLAAVNFIKINGFVNPEVPIFVYELPIQLFIVPS